MKTRSLFTNISFALFSIGLVVWPLLTLSPIASGMVKNFIFGNATTQGKVLYVGPSTVGKAPAVVGYGYDTPDFPRKPWSFQREQVVAPKDLARFRPGMNVTVEYSQASSGASRLKGYGKARSVFLDELRLPFFLLLAFLIIRPFHGVSECVDHDIQTSNTTKRCIQPITASPFPNRKCSSISTWSLFRLHARSV